MNESINQSINQSIDRSIEKDRKLTENVTEGKLKQQMSGLGNCKVRPEVIYDWKTMVEMICGKGVFLVWSERE